MDRFLNQIICGDCLEVMKEIPDKSVDLVLTDPPYNISKAEWDKWKRKEDYIEWMGQIFKECERLLKDNGSFYFFHNDMMQIKNLMQWLEDNTKFVFKSMITWNKPNFKRYAWNNRNPEKCMDRNWFPNVEYCLFYTFQDETGLNGILPMCFEPYLDYMTAERKKAGLSIKQCNELTGYISIASHWFWQPNRVQPQPRFIQEHDYCKLQTTGYFRRPYEELRQEYEELRQEYESLRYPFNLSEVQENISCVWESKESNSGKYHPTQKPVDLIQKIIKVSSNEGDIILDPFIGSGTTAIAAHNTGRKFIGIEKEQRYVEIAQKRLEQAQAQQSLFA